MQHSLVCSRGASSHLSHGHCWNTDLKLTNVSSCWDLKINDGWKKSEENKRLISDSQRTLTFKHALNVFLLSLCFSSVSVEAGMFCPWDIFHMCNNKEFGKVQWPDVFSLLHSLGRGGKGEDPEREVAVARVKPPDEVTERFPPQPHKVLSVTVPGAWYQGCHPLRRKATFVQSQTSHYANQTNKMNATLRHPPWLDQSIHIFDFTSRAAVPLFHCLPCEEEDVWFHSSRQPSRPLLLAAITAVRNTLGDVRSPETQLRRDSDSAPVTTCRCGDSVFSEKLFAGIYSNDYIVTTRFHISLYSFLYCSTCTRSYCDTHRVQTIILKIAYFFGQAVYYIIHLNLNKVLSRFLCLEYLNAPTV